MSKVSAKNQITIPARVLRQLGIKPGDDVSIRAEDHRIVIEPDGSRLDRVMHYAGSMTFPEGYLAELRNEWHE